MIAWQWRPNHRMIAAVAALTALLLVCVSALADLSASGQHDPAQVGALGVMHVSRASAASSASLLMLALYEAAGICFVATGVTAWLLRPQFKSGPLLVLAGWAYLASGLRASANPVAFTAGIALWSVSVAVVIHVVLAFPDGRLRSGWERTMAAGMYMYLPAAALLDWAFIDLRSRLGNPDAPHSILSFGEHPHAFHTVTTATNTTYVLLSVILLGIVVARLARGTSAYRAAFRPLAAAFLGKATAMTLFIASATMPGFVLQWLLYIQNPLTALIPVAILVGLLRSRARPGVVGKLMVELGAAPIGDDLVRALRRVLGDPTLEILRRGPPAAPESGRAVTILERDGVFCGALVHDAALANEPELIASVRAAAALAMENERLHAAVRAQLQDAQESRLRIVEAGDAERRRIERNLHDGAQQRLVAAILALRRAERHGDQAGIRALLDEGASEIEAALVEIRELAAGMNPRLLTEQGLDAALESLVERMPIPVEFHGQVGCRLRPAVEAAGYFAVVELLTNAIRHGHTPRARIDARLSSDTVELTVTDHGTGEAHPCPGGGIAGIQDRVQALGGHLKITTTGTTGTVIRVELPTMQP
jgi:signal transduction histidine kinase